MLGPMPAFYFKPETLNGIIDHLVSKILDHLEIKKHLYKSGAKEVNYQPYIKKDHKV